MENKIRSGMGEPKEDKPMELGKAKSAEWRQEMKRIALMLAAGLLVAAAFALSGCGGDDSENADSGNTVSGGYVADTSSLSSGVSFDKTAKVVDVKEKMFVAQINDIYLNVDDYIGKTLKYEGMFTQYSWEETGMTYYMVYRASPGCCGADGVAGFEVIWPDAAAEGYPNENDWCEVVGTLESYDEDGESYLRVILDSLTVKDERGAEFVSQ